MKRVLRHVEEDPSQYGTSARIKGMLTVASEVCYLVQGYTFLPEDFVGASRTLLLYTGQDSRSFPLRSTTTSGGFVSLHRVRLEGDVTSTQICTFERGIRCLKVACSWRLSQDKRSTFVHI